MAELNKEAKEKLDQFLAKRSFGEKFALGRALSNLNNEDKNNLINSVNKNPHIFDAMERYYDPKEKPPDLIAISTKAEADLLQRNPQPLRTTQLVDDGNQKEFFGSKVELGVPVLAEHFNFEVNNLAPDDAAPVVGKKQSYDHKNSLTA